jgi:hypothetical protein
LFAIRIYPFPGSRRDTPREFVDPPYVLTEEMLGCYLAQLVERIEEVDDEQYAPQRVVDVFQID